MTSTETGICPVMWPVRQAVYAAGWVARRCDIPPELWALARALADPGRLGGGALIRHALQTAVRSELSERTEAH